MPKYNLRQKIRLFGKNGHFKISEVPTEKEPRYFVYKCDDPLFACYVEECMIFLEQTVNPLHCYHIWHNVDITVGVKRTVENCRKCGIRKEEV